MSHPNLSVRGLPSVPRSVDTSSGDDSDWIRCVDSAAMNEFNFTRETLPSRDVDPAPVAGSRLRITPKIGNIPFGQGGQTPRLVAL